MIRGIGCDIVNIERIAKLYKKSPEQFLERIFTKNEIANAPENIEQKISYLAKRFAAKEAFAKALGTGIGGEVSFNEIEILNDQNGMPYITSLKNQHSDLKINLSLSDEKNLALAFITIE